MLEGPTARRLFLLLLFRVGIVHGPLRLFFQKDRLGGNPRHGPGFGRLRRFRAGAGWLASARLLVDLAELIGRQIRIELQRRIERDRLLHLLLGGTFLLRRDVDHREVTPERRLDRGRALLARTHLDRGGELRLRELHIHRQVVFVDGRIGTRARSLVVLARRVGRTMKQKGTHERSAPDNLPTPH
jgi:hypothetical protein